MISNVKKVFIKAPSRVKEFKKLYPQVAFPPEPVITRWGTWIEAVIYYEENFDKVKTVIDKFDPKAAKSIQKSQNLLRNQNIKADVSLIA